MTAADPFSSDHRPLGTSGLVVSRVGLGCNNFGRRVGLDGARAVVDAARFHPDVIAAQSVDLYRRTVRQFNERTGKGPPVGRKP